MNMDDKEKDCVLSIFLNTIILIFPFFIAVIYKEQISEKNVTLSVAMFLMTVSIGATEKFKFYLFLILSLFLVATYGAIPPESKIDGFKHYQILLGLGGVVALGFDKYEIHVRKGQPLNSF